MIVNPLAIECAHCLAPIGEACRGDDGPEEWPHIRRHGDAYRAAKEADAALLALARRLVAHVGVAALSEVAEAVDAIDSDPSAEDCDTQVINHAYAVSVDGEPRQSFAQAAAYALRGMAATSKEQP